MAFLDRQSPADQFAELLLTGLLVELAEHGPVADLARLGHRQELEAVEAVGVLAEVGRHHLGRLGFRFLGFFEDRGLLAVASVGELGAAALGLFGLLAHAGEHLRHLVVLDQAFHFLGRSLGGLGEPQDLRELLLQRGQLSHRSSFVGHRPVAVDVRVSRWVPLDPQIRNARPYGHYSA